MAWRKRLELFGRRLLVLAVGLLLGVRRREVTLPARARIIVVRLDERLGNVVMLTPLLASLRARFPDAVIDLLASGRNEALLATHPALDGFLAFAKRALLSGRGPFGTLLGLRRRRYDLALDAANPTDPSATQALLVRWSGARHTVGFAVGPFARLYSAPVSGEGAGPHEIDMRLALLAALPGTDVVRETSLRVEAPPASAPSVIVNIGARLADKRLDAEAYARLCALVCERGHACLVTYGPAERGLAEETVRREPRARLAPPTSALELARLMKQASRVITCDTGPMHVAVAVGTPTCGIFVTTEPERYGYARAPHAAVDARGDGSYLEGVRSWLGS